MSERSKSKQSGKKSTSKKSQAGSTKTSKTFTLKTKYTVLPGLKRGQRYTTRPKDFQGLMWLKRTLGYKKKTCTLSEGILNVYNRSKDLNDNKSASCVDLGSSVISHQENTHLSINADDQVYRFKIKDADLFHNWLEQLTKHRLYRLDKLMNGSASPSAKINQKNAPTQHQQQNQCPTGFVESPTLTAQRGTSPESDEAINALISTFAESTTKIAELEKAIQKADQGRPVNTAEVVARNESLRKTIEVHKRMGQLLQKLRSENAEQKKLPQQKEQQRDEMVAASLASKYSQSPSAVRLAQSSVQAPSTVVTASQIAPTQTASQIAAQSTTPGTSPLTESATPIVSAQSNSKRDQAPVKSSSLVKPEEETSPSKAEEKKPIPAPSPIAPIEARRTAEEEEEDKSEGDSDEETNKPDQCVAEEYVQAAAALAETSQKSSAVAPTCTFRNRLPVTTVPCNVSMWSLLKNSIGRDMTKLSFPVEMFEPLGTLQVLCEELEYSHLLDKAIDQKDPHMRMVLIACFAVSRYAASAHRGQRKPFNPLEGETYENKRDDLGWSFLAEQVSHHPPISACQAKGRGWEFWQGALYTVAFWGKSIEAEQKTPANLILIPHRERYQWNKVITSIQNLFSGTKVCEHYGVMTIKCSSGIWCKLTFKKASITGKQHEVTGSVHDIKNQMKFRLFGKWSESLYLGDSKKSQCVWSANQPLPQSPQYYGFNAFAMSLNELTANLREQLPPTDSRFRPDQRLLEDGKFKEAQEKKHQLEDNQRARRKQNKFKPKWFKEEKQNEWKFIDAYWEARKGHFSQTSFDTLW